MYHWIRNFSLSIFVFGSFYPLLASTATQLEVRFIPYVFDELPEDVEIVAIAADGTQERYLIAQDRVVLALPANEELQLTCSGQRSWCPRLSARAVTESEGSKRLDLPIYDAVRIRGRLRAPRGAELPDVGVVQGSLWEDGRPTKLEIRAQLTVENSEISFLAPAAVMDLRFSFQHWGPIYRWRLKTEYDEQSFDLGDLRLFQGASVAGWVRAEASELPIARASISLALLGSESASRSRNLNVEAKSDEHGFFQLKGVAPGRYRLEIEARDSARFVLEELEVPSDSETMLGALHLEPPLRAHVILDPPRDPLGKPWRLRLRPVRASPEEDAIEITAGVDGMVSVKGLRPAEYVVSVSTTSGARLAVEEHFFAADSLVEIAVPLTGIRGVVRLGNEPLEAHIELLTGNSDSTKLESDAEGSFHGFIRRPSRGWMLASVGWSDGSREHTRLLELQFDLPEQGDVSLEIEVPNESASGRVVNDRGEPVEGAEVTAFPASPRLSGIAKNPRVVSAQDGTFELTGLGKELYRMQARRGAALSELVNIHLDTGLEYSEVQLVIYPTRTFEGRVINHEGEGLAGATVDFVTRGPAPASIDTVTDWEGRFSVRLPETARDAVIVVFAPSQLLWSECRSLDGELLIRMPSLPGGTLRVVTRGRPDLPPAGGTIFVTSARGGIFKMGLLHNWRRTMKGEAHSDPEKGLDMFTVPAVAPGEYSLVRSPPAQTWELVEAACSGAFLGQRSASLRSGGVAELSLDVREHQERGREPIDSR